MRWLVLLFVMACSPAMDPAALRAQLTPLQIARLQVPMIFVSADQTGVAATLVPVRQIGPVRIWQARDGVQVITRGGLVTGTRGLGHDLMSAEIAGLTAALAGGAPRYARQMSYLKGDLRTTIATYDCRIRRAGTTPRTPVVTIWRETCDGPDRFENTYHRGADGTLWWSRQWISTRFGTLEIETIRP